METVLEEHHSCENNHAFGSAEYEFGTYLDGGWTGGAYEGEYPGL